MADQLEGEEFPVVRSRGERNSDRVKEDEGMNEIKHALGHCILLTLFMVEATGIRAQGLVMSSSHFSLVIKYISKCFTIVRACQPCVCIYLSNHLMLNLPNLTANNFSLSLSLNTCLTLLLAKVYTFHSYATQLSHREVVAKAMSY